jgi:hypothetical protein
LGNTDLRRAFLLGLFFLRKRELLLQCVFLRQLRGGLGVPEPLRFGDRGFQLFFFGFFFFASQRPADRRPRLELGARGVAVLVFEKKVKCKGKLRVSLS